MPFDRPRLPQALAGRAQGLFAAALLVAVAACSDSGGGGGTVAGPATYSIVKISGDTQTTAFDSILPQPIIVKVLLGSTPKAGVQVYWTSSTGLVSQSVDTTDAQGLASVRFTLGIAGGNHIAIARIDSGSVKTVSFTGIARPWTACADEGGLCKYTGSRDVRYGVGTQWTQLTTYEEQYCLVPFFNNVDPAPGKVKHCEMGPAQKTTLTNALPAAMTVGLPMQIPVPKGVVGNDTAVQRATTWQPYYSDGSGSFRTTCDLSHYSFDDPIVHPNQPGAAHLHIFFGNTGTNAASTSTSIASSGKSTCRGGVLNRSAYWAPALIDTRDSSVIVPYRGVFYYKTGYTLPVASIQPMPVGLRMIAGNPSATAEQPDRYIATWACRDHYDGDHGSIPNCPAGDVLQMRLVFPQCWDGRNLDSPDHQSHMAYPIWQVGCPVGYPVNVPEVAERFEYTVPASADLSKWRLSSDIYSKSLPGGYSAHADWMLGWNVTTMRTFVTQCLNVAHDCGVGVLGNGFEIY